jgi:predicted metal-binding membrane protein
MALPAAATGGGGRASPARTGTYGDRPFLAAFALLTAAAWAGTAAGARSMAAMGELPLPGGWALSLAWLPTCGQGWPATAASFLGMWVVMMAAMMLPPLVPPLRCYRLAVTGAVGPGRRDGLTALVGLGYLAVWALCGAVVFALGAALAVTVIDTPDLAHAMPLAAGLAVLAAGAVQLSPWRLRHLARCLAPPARAGALAADAGTAWRHGLRLGCHCACSCAGAMAVLLVAGVMDLRAMAAAAAVIAAERLVPGGAAVGQAAGAVAIVAGLVLAARAVAGLG